MRRVTLLMAAALPAVAVALRLHNASLFVQDIERSMAFYTLLGFKDTHRFTVDRARAAWLSPPQPEDAARIELIELPKNLVKPEEDGDDVEAKPKGVPDFRFGQSHLAFDISDVARAWVPEAPRLAGYLRKLNDMSERKFQKSISLMEPPAQMMFGQEVWETAVIRDPDGVRIELMTYDATLEHQMRTWKTADEAEAEGAEEAAEAEAEAEAEA
eukprot:CAMPEP_0118886910 /NCGR_PEP_ID=MMETSP1163-20130328/24802_1 /TAXON_ID=124430 /ORGANISM="Phaeomonas parva, Strain CCMP2877" /LENGTH=213 /DNA_ID=CAMNT_0006825239 /DNA_START=104 /DNA_END=745 /DNA_ORIENTATION=-